MLMVLLSDGLIASSTPVLPSVMGSVKAMPIVWDWKGSSLIRRSLIGFALPNAPTIALGLFRYLENALSVLSSASMTSPKLSVSFSVAMQHAPVLVYAWGLVEEPSPQFVAEHTVRVEIG